MISKYIGTRIFRLKTRQIKHKQECQTLVRIQSLHSTSRLGFMSESIPVKTLEVRSIYMHTTHTSMCIRIRLGPRERGERHVYSYLKSAQ